MRFFVYGTLKSGKHNNYLLRRATLLGEAKTEPVYTLFDGPYPIVTRGGSTPIVGEVFETNDEDVIDNIFSLERCSRVQGHQSNWYDFDTIETPYGEANIFVMNEGKSGRPDSKILNSGQWG